MLRNEIASKLRVIADGTVQDPDGAKDALLTLADWLVGLHNAVCQMCGTPMPRVALSRMYCSRACKQEAYRERLGK